MKATIKMSLVAVCLGAVLALPTTTTAQQKKGGQLQRELLPVHTMGDVEKLKTGDTFAMACSKCKTIWVAEVRRDAKGAELLKAHGKLTRVVGKHQCKGCGGKIEITGHGKGRQAKIKHTCSSCGDKSTYCCATGRDSGPTKGMEKKKNK